MGLLWAGGGREVSLAPSLGKAWGGVTFGLGPRRAALAVRREQIWQAAEWVADRGRNATASTGSIWRFFLAGTFWMLVDWPERQSER